MKTNEVYYWAVGVSIFNSILLVVIFWRQKFREPDKPLFDTEKYLADFLKTVKTLRKNVIQNLF